MPGCPGISCKSLLWHVTEIHNVHYQFALLDKLIPLFYLLSKSLKLSSKHWHLWKAPLALSNFMIMVLKAVGYKFISSVQSKNLDFQRGKFKFSDLPLEQLRDDFFFSQHLSLIVMAGRQTSTYLSALMYKLFISDLELTLHDLAVKVIFIQCNDLVFLTATAHLNYNKEKTAHFRIFTRNIYNSI